MSRIANTAPQVGRALTVLAVVLLGACGFQLRGLATESSLDSISLRVADAYGPLDVVLREVLAESDVEVAAPGAAPYHVELTGERNTRRALSSGGRGQVAEYEVNIEVTFQLFDADGNVLQQPAVLRIARTFAFDPTSLQATNEEEERVRGEMRRELASRILRRVETRARRGG